jgi:ankyrin repeat protein
MTNLEPLAQDVIDEFVIAAHHDLPRVKDMLQDDPRLLNENATWIETPLAAAAHTASLDIAEYLIAQGAPLDICAAATLGLRDEVTAFLDDNPALINATGAHDIPLLFHAAIGRDPGMVQLLVERGADVNEGYDKTTAMHGAAGFGRTEVVRYLLDQGADFAAVDHDGRTPLDIAEETDHADVIALLRPLMEPNE